MFVALAPLPVRGGTAPDYPKMPEYGPWHSSYVGGGGYLQDVLIARTNPKRLYTYTDMAGIYRSDDAGESWRQIEGGMASRKGDYEVRSLWIDPRDPDVILAAMKQGSDGQSVYRSDDGGTTWTGVLKHAPFYGNGPVNRSDGCLFAAKFDRPDELLVATQGGDIFKSPDNGKTWRPVHGPSNLYACGLLVDRTDSSHVWLWTRTAPSDTTDSDFPPFAGGLYESHDFGDSWTKLVADSPTHIVQDPVDGRLLYGIFKNRTVRSSRHDGRTWEEFSDGLHDKVLGTSREKYITGDRFQAIATGPDFVVVGTTNGTFYRLACGQRQWKPLSHVQTPAKYDWTQGKAAGRSEFGDAMGWVSIDPTDPTHWYCTDWYAVWQSHDSGATWTLSITGIENTVIHCLVGDPSNPQTVYMSMSDNNLFRSDTAGAGFHQKSPRGLGHVKGVDFSPLTPNALVCIGGGDWVTNQVLLSNDRGDHWTASPMTGLPVGKGIVWHSVTVKPKKTGRGLARRRRAGRARRRRPYRSQDGGRSWAWLGDGLPAGQPFFNESVWNETGQEICIASDGKMLATGRMAKALYRLDPGQTRWAAVETPWPAALSVIAVDAKRAGRFYAAPQGRGLWLSDDGGRGWRQVRTEPVACLATDRGLAGRLVIGQAEKVLVSLDGGAHWLDLDPQIDRPWRRPSVVAVNGDVVLVGTSGGGVFWRTIPVQ